MAKVFRKMYASGIFNRVMPSNVTSQNVDSSSVNTVTSPTSVTENAVVPTSGQPQTQYMMDNEDVNQVDNLYDNTVPDMPSIVNKTKPIQGSMILRNYTRGGLGAALSRLPIARIMEEQRRGRSIGMAKFFRR